MKNRRGGGKMSTKLDAADVFGEAGAFICVAEPPSGVPRRLQGPLRQKHFKIQGPL